MPIGLVLFSLFVVVPLLEIAAFVVIGGQIGLAATLAMVLVTAVIGSALLRWQGFSILRRIQTEMDAGRLPGEALGHGLMILVAGVLLLTPGFVTDALGFLLFIPAVRTAIWHLIRSRLSVTVVTAGMAGGRASGRAGGHRDGRPDAGTIDLDPDEYSAEPNPSSPWTGNRIDRNP